MSESKKFNQSLAVIIGIDNYSNGIARLKNPVNDAKKLADVLQNQHKYEVLTYFNQDATLSNLNHLLTVELPQRVTKDDRLLFYFAGHGEGVDTVEPAGYLIPQDARQGKPETYLPMLTLQEALEALECRHFLGILDCCFAARLRWCSLRDLEVATDIIYKEKYDRFISYTAWQMIASAGAHEKAADDHYSNGQRAGHSPFAAALIRGLEGDADRYSIVDSQTKQGDGIVTATELYAYVQHCVIHGNQASNSEPQTPLSWTLKKHDGGEYIFLPTGEEPNLEPAPTLDPSTNPYRGLNSFEKNDKKLFFGRDKITKELQAFVETHPLTVVLGASGSGKSSLVKAGLLPYFEAKTEPRWAIALLRPGTTPLQALKVELEKYNLNTNLLLIIDQAEELITLRQETDEREVFLQRIAKEIDAHPTTLRVIFTLRSDFEPQLENFALKPHWWDAKFYITVMNREELREAIEKPAEARVMYFDPHKLVDQLIDEVLTMPGPLPLLSYTLSELYLKYLDRQNAVRGGQAVDRSIIQQDYDDLGGVTLSLTKAADRIYEKWEKRGQGAIVQMVMLRMVASGSGELARRRVFLSELEYPEDKADLVNGVINDFVNEARLLVRDTDKDGNHYIEPAHDALVKGWSRLADWVKAEKNLDLQRRLTPAALAWKTNETPYLWNADPYLDVLQKEVLNPPDRNWFNQAELEFVQRSIQRKYRNVHLRWTAVIGAFAAITSVSVATFFQWSQAQRRSSVAFAESSRANLLANRSMEGTINAVKAVRLLENPLLRDRDAIYTEISDALIWANSENKERLRLQGVVDFEFSPNSQFIVSYESNADVSPTLWSITGEQIASLGGGEQSIKFSPDSKFLVTNSDEDALRVWSTSGQLIKEISGIDQENFSLGEFS
ncbi:MAG: hypothetical protein HC881_12570, partial [Leptolyngbyaceae cyanobacterium SL_7_1]|nr:hypothetical protein [Leptolyngbyaceae cyanobacterium SL_7_1]